NRDNECFKYAVLSAINPVQDRKDNAYLPNHYLPFQSNLDLFGITFPSPLRNIGKFAKNDSLSINVYGFTQKNEVFCLLISEEERESTSICYIPQIRREA
ncbi:hypothetical protein AVEN_19178-1, partial [Araneus ventricosus]